MSAIKFLSFLWMWRKTERLILFHAAFISNIFVCQSKKQEHISVCDHRQRWCVERCRVQGLCSRSETPLGISWRVHLRSRTKWWQGAWQHDPHLMALDELLNEYCSVPLMFQRRRSTKTSMSQHTSSLKSRTDAWPDCDVFGQLNMFTFLSCVVYTAKKCRGNVTNTFRSKHCSYKLFLYRLLPYACFALKVEMPTGLHWVEGAPMKTCKK